MSRTKNIDIGFKMSFNNKARSSYSMENLKNPIKEDDKLVRIALTDLVSAPEEWNFYPSLDEDEFEKLVFSILELGLLHPIVVLKKGDRHIILSGHNRVRAYQAIVEDIEALQSGEKGRFIESLSKELKLSDFQQIMAVVKEDITDDDAREIIIDANYVQRKLGPKLITRSIIEKYRIIQDKRKSVNHPEYKSQKTREIVAREFQLSGRHVDRYKKLEKLHEDLLELFYQGKISLELASKLAGLKTNVQEYITENYLSVLTKYPSRISAELKASLTMKEIDWIFSNQILPKEQMKISVTLQGKTRHFVIEEERLIQEVLDLLEE